MTTQTVVYLKNNQFTLTGAPGRIIPQYMVDLIDSVLSPIRTVQTTSYTLTQTDQATCVEMDSTGDITVTIPPNASVPFPIGAWIDIYRKGSGSVIILPGVGVTLRSPGTAAIGAQFATAKITQRTTDEWILADDYGTAPPHLSAPYGYSSLNLIFEDQFLSSTVDATKWQTYMQDNSGVWSDSGNLVLPQSGPNAGSYQANYYDPGQVTTGLPGLRIQAVTDSAHSGLGYTWKSGVLCSFGKFSFTGGYAQIRCQWPDCSSGMWPVFWHLVSNAEEIDTFEGGMLSAGHLTNRIISTADHMTSSQVNLQDLGTDLSAGYHVYALEYVPGVSLRFFFDGVQINNYTTNIPTGAKDLVINLDVAQSAASAFHSVYSGGTPSPSSLLVSDVQVYALPTSNAVRNPVNAGPPVIGTPGTLPTNWSYGQGSDALSTQIVAFGWLPTNNLPYIDIRVFGTPAASTGVQIFVDSAAVIGVGNYTISLYLAMIAGSMAHLTSVSAFIDSYNGATNLSFATLGTGAISPTSALARYVGTGTTPATTNKAAVWIALNGVTSGQAIDITLRIAGVQLESGAVVNGWVP